MTDLPPPAAPPPPEAGTPATTSGPPAGWSPTTASPAAPARQPGKWRAYLILGGIAVFLGIVLWVVRNNASVDDLTAGTCFDLPTRSADISTVTRHACTEAHDAEVFHVVEYSDGPSYPISLSLNSFIDTACVPVFATYVGQAVDLSDDLTIGYFYPSREGWNTGDRTFTCYVVRIDEAELTKSLKGSGGS